MKCNNAKSKQREEKFGVSQGSILGPLLFVIHVNILPTYINKAALHLHADYTAITVTANNIFDMTRSMEQQIKAADLWLSAN